MIARADLFPQTPEPTRAAIYHVAPPGNYWLCVMRDTPSECALRFARLSLAPDCPEQALVSNISATNWPSTVKNLGELDALIG